MERENLEHRCERRSPSGHTTEGESTEAVHRGGNTRSSEEVPDKRMERRGVAVEPDSMRQPVNGANLWDEPLNPAKPISITLSEVYLAYEAVKAKKGAAGVASRPHRPNQVCVARGGVWSAGVCVSRVRQSQ